jgi:hypothetical protein
MKRRTLLVLISFTTIPMAQAIDDFQVQMTRYAHDDMSLRYDVFTVGEQRSSNFDSEWFQLPKVALGFGATHHNRFRDRVHSELYRPMIDLSFQTIGKINFGIAYAHGFASDELPLGFRRFDFEGNFHSIGGYLGRQWDCGFKLSGAWSYSTGEYGVDDFRRKTSLDWGGGSGAIGYARSFGEKKFGRNLSVDTSANILYQSEEDFWHFVWMAKLGHNICERFAIYGMFNLFHELDRRSGGLPIAYGGYHPYGDETWGELGGGFQARLCRGLSFTAEATTPVLDEGTAAHNAFQVRAGLNWSF